MLLMMIILFAALLILLGSGVWVAFSLLGPLVTFV